ncbi:MAG TPA: class I SAM-dependent methyltransferase [Polyangiaceae bacterium]|nr:class I SAM-dependent methyltransferase [Polyangiaceae bacterium]
MPLAPAAQALLDLGHWLLASGYHFITVTPATHARVLAREGARSARSLRDAFGWSLPFDRGALPERAWALLEAAGALAPAGGRWRSAVRFSSLGGALYAHSAYPTDDTDAVFFGPDTYRFAAFLARHVAPTGCVVDVGCGAGSGGLAWAGRAERIVLADVNPRALALAEVNAALAGAPGVELVRSDVLDGVGGGPPDVVVANPPYLVDESERAYRHGGGGLGTDLSVRIVREALARVRPGGRVLLYSGAPVVDGRDLLRAALVPALEAAGARYEYEELDPDVFGEELERPAYARAGAERIAVVGVTATAPA